jgi:hypothetical protein
VQIGDPCFWIEDVVDEKRLQMAGGVDDWWGNLCEIRDQRLP